jgi:hypothetical protein
MGVPITQAVPVKIGKVGKRYVNSQVDSIYTGGEVEAALTNPGATKVTEQLEDIARFCAQTAHIERCYCAKIRNKEQDEVLQLELFRLLTTTKRTLTSGQMEAMTRVY